MMIESRIAASTSDQRAGSDGAVLALTAAIAKGDAGALAVFYEAWFDRSYAIARSITRRDEAFCLDVVQDTMLRVVRALRPLPDRDALERWMRRVIHTTALDHLRRELRRVRREERGAAAAPASVPETPESSDRLELEERLAWLEQQLRALPQSDRKLLEERFVHGRTLAAAGTAVGLTGDAAHGRIRRLIDQLRAASRRIFP